MAAAVFIAVLGPRPDIAAAAETPRFLFKFVITVTLAASAFGVVRALSPPGEAWRGAIRYLAAVPALVHGGRRRAFSSAAGHMVRQADWRQHHPLPDVR